MKTGTKMDQKTKIHSGMFARSMQIPDIKPRAEGEDDTRTLDISFASEQPYGRWFGDEILACESQYIDMNRFDSGLGTVLFNHNRDDVIGHVERAYIDDTNHVCRAEIRFDDDELSEKVYQKVKSGTLQGVSVGYRVNEFTYFDERTTSANGRWSGEAYVATKWTPMEISIVTVPADDSVGIGRDEDGERDIPVVYNIPPQGEKEMEHEKEETKSTKPTPEQLAEQARTAERNRVKEIMDMGRHYGVDVTKQVAEGTSVDETRAFVLDEIAKRNVPVDTHIEVEERDKFKAAAVDALLMRSGATVEKAAPGATELRGMTLLDLARRCLEDAGNSIKSYDKMIIVREALTGADAFPEILADVAHKTLGTAYQAAPVTYPIWTRKGSNVDFKPAHRVSMSEADELKPIPENGQYEYAEVKDSGISVTVGTFGRKFSLTRKAIINDDLGALTSIPQKFGMAANRGINAKVYKMLSGSKTYNGADLFTSKNNNLVATGSVPTVMTLGEASAMMARQKNISGKETLNIRPAYLIVPPELFVVASQLISSNVDPAKYNATVNPYFNGITVIQDAELTDTKAWYLAGSQAITDTIEVTYLNGVETPYLEQRVGFDVDGIEFKIRHDYAVTVLDYRALLKNPGAAE